MQILWLINNLKEGNGFVAQRVQIVTYSAVCVLYGRAVIKDHGRTGEGIPIGQILTPKDILCS